MTKVIIYYLCLTNQIEKNLNWIKHKLIIACEFSWADYLTEMSISLSLYACCFFKAKSATPRPQEILPWNKLIIN